MSKYTLNNEMVSLCEEIKQAKEQQDAWAQIVKEKKEKLMEQLSGAIEETIASLSELHLTTSMQFYDATGKEVASLSGVGYKMDANEVLLAELCERHPAAVGKLVKVSHSPIAKAVLAELAEPSGELRSLLAAAIGYKPATPTLSIK